MLAVRLPFLFCTLLLWTPSAVAAQTPARAHISFGYRYLRAQSINRSNDPHPGLERLAAGGEASVTVRVAPVVSLVAAFGKSSGTITVLQGGLPLNSTQTGTVTFSVWDVVGGVKLSRGDSGPFVALLAGRSVPGMQSQSVSSAAQSLISLDQGKRTSFALRPMAGVDLGTASHRAGVRLEAGWDIIPHGERVTSAAVLSETVTHFRMAASVTIRLGG